MLFGVLPVMTGVTVFALVSCGKNESESDVKIIGGSKVKAETIVTSPVRSFLATYDSYKRTQCTGTFVDATHFLTATHCVLDENGTEPSSSGFPGIGKAQSIFTNGKALDLYFAGGKLKNRIKEISAKYPEVVANIQKGALDDAYSEDELKVKKEFLLLAHQYSRNITEFGKIDVAVVTISKKDSAALKDVTFPSINKERQKDIKQDKLFAVGFGATEIRGVKGGELDFAGQGQKYYANVAFDNWADDLISIFYKGTFVPSESEELEPGMIAPGDSGGPLFRCLSGDSAENCKKAEILGVWSHYRGSLGKLNQFTMRGYAASVSSEEVQKFLAIALTKD